MNRPTLWAAAVSAVCLSSSFAADNVILFIGDGMGFEHVKAGRVLVNGSSASPLLLEGLGNTAQSITALPNGTATDSATAGTALATGYQSPVNGVISMGSDGSIKTTILELAKSKGFRTGIITTDDIGGATPGAFGAHEPDRSRMSQIRYDYLQDDTTYHHPASLPNLVLGGGYDDGSYPELATSLGYFFVSSASGLDGAAEPLLGLFGTSWAPMTAMAYRPAGTSQPLFSEMVTKALDLLANDSGFFLMAESANIDKLSHSNDGNFVFEVAELDAAVKAASAWKNAHPNDNTLILVTADHETGGLSIPDQNIAPGSVPSMSWSTTGHTTRNVPVFATWPASLNGLTVDNTEIFFLLDDYLNLPAGKPPVITGVTVLGITETGATVQWDTVEPSTTRLLDGSAIVSEDLSRVTRHTVVCGGLTPDTPYTLTAASMDIAGNTGTAEVSFTTTASDYNARVLAEPVVSIGVVSGTIDGVANPDDGLVQVVTEAPSRPGSRLLVEYTLHTAVAPDSIEALRLEGALGWSGNDGAVDELITQVRILLPEGVYGWQTITLPFKAVPPAEYVDANGDIVLRFVDSASIKRERKDTLTIDYLVGEVGVGTTAPTLPTRPGSLSASEIGETAVTLSWTDSLYETGYLIWRYTAEEGWVVAAETDADVVTFTDTDLTPGVSYTYAVRALNASGYADSDPLKVQTLPGLLAPIKVQASADRGAVNLTWTDNNTIETGYEILRATTPDGNFGSVVTVGADVASYTDQAVVRHTIYYYQVRAVNEDGTGPESATVSAKVH